MDILHSYSSDGCVSIYIVNKSTVVVPSFGFGCTELDSAHITNQICRLKQCKSLRNVHSLAKKSNNICIHNLLVIKCGTNEDSEGDSVVSFKADHFKTVSVLLSQLSKNFPSLNEEELKAFLPQNSAFITELRYYSSVRKKS